MTSAWQDPETRRPSQVASAGVVLEAPTDARVARSRAAVLDAATELLVTRGPSAVTVDAVVAESGVAKSTIYRHWRSRDELLVDVFRTCAPVTRPAAESASFGEALESFVDQIVDHLNDPRWAKVIPALLMLRSHEPELAEMEDEIKRKQDGFAHDVIRRGIAEGALVDDLDVDEASTLLMGPLLFSHLTGAAEVDRDYGRRIAARFRAAYARPAD